MVCVPLLKELEVKLACELEIGRVPNDVVPSRNTTVPVGTADGPPVDRFATNVTACPDEEGFRLLLSDKDEVAGGVGVPRVTGLDVLAT
jgi:hypothetical protein